MASAERALHFGGHVLPRGIAVLALWAVVPLLLATVIGRRRDGSVATHAALAA